MCFDPRWGKKLAAASLFITNDSERKCLTACRHSLQLDWEVVLSSRNIYQNFSVCLYSIYILSVCLFLSFILCCCCCCWFPLCTLDRIEMRVVYRREKWVAYLIVVEIGVWFRSSRNNRISKRFEKHSRVSAVAIWLHRLGLGRSSTPMSSSSSSMIWLLPPPLLLPLLLAWGSKPLVCGRLPPLPVRQR